MKSKKTIESFVGKIIYGFLLFMPLLSILTKSLYVVLNDNAVESYSGGLIDKTYLDSREAPLNNVYYSFNDETTYYNNTRKIIYYDSIEYISGNLTANQQNSLIQSSYMNLWRDNENSYNYITWENAGSNYSAYTYNFTVKLNITATTAFTNVMYETTFYKEINQNTLDNVFEYAINQVENNSLYSWTEETAIYQVVHEMTTTIQVDSSFVDLLLTYWFLITIIYILFDIAFVMLMYVHNKIHGLLEK